MVNGGGGLRLAGLASTEATVNVRGLQRLLERFGLGARADVEPLDLLAVGADEARLEGVVARGGERRHQRPVFARDELLDFELAVADEPQRHRLHAEAFGAWLAKRQATAGAAWVTALLVAIGIGLHNLGEGLAIGAALGLGQVALGRLLILGFTLHNTTEGLAIVAPIARTPVSLRLLLLGLVGGLPTIAGAWIGGFFYSPTLSVLFLDSYGTRS